MAERRLKREERGGKIAQGCMCDALVCTDCTHRHQSIEERLKDKRALRCTCRGQQHSYANEKCDLFSKGAGERTWPGSNVKVSREDWQFCDRMRARKRRKAEDEAI